MLLISCWALSNFVILVSCVSYSHDRESRTHHFYMQKLLHWKNSISIPSTHAYPFWCSICHKVSSQNSLQQRHELCIEKKEKKRGAWRPMKKERERWPKVHAKTRKLAMSKNMRKRQNHGTSYSLTFHSIHHISTHMHFSIMVVWLAYSLGSIFDIAKYLKQVCLSFLPALSSTNSLLEVGEIRHTKRPWWG